MWFMYLDDVNEVVESCLSLGVVIRPWRSHLHMWQPRARQSNYVYILDILLMLLSCLDS